MTTREINLESLDLRYGRLRVVDRRQEARLMASIEEHGQQDAIIVVVGDRKTVEPKLGGLGKLEHRDTRGEPLSDKAESASRIR